VLHDLVEILKDLVIVQLQLLLSLLESFDLLVLLAQQLLQLFFVFLLLEDEFLVALADHLDVVLEAHLVLDFTLNTLFVVHCVLHLFALDHALFMGDG
jgi:hypothetical protein